MKDDLAYKGAEARASLPFLSCTKTATGGWIGRSALNWILGWVAPETHASTRYMPQQKRVYSSSPSEGKTVRTRCTVPVAQPASPCEVSVHLGSPFPPVYGANACGHFVQLLALVRSAYSRLAAQSIFRVNNLQDTRLPNGRARLPSSSDPMGTLAATVSLLHWVRKCDPDLFCDAHAYRARLVAASALFLAHKLKSEETWPPGANVAANVMSCFVQGLSDAQYIDRQRASCDIFECEAWLLKQAPVHLLCDENVLCVAELELARLLARGALSAEEACAALAAAFALFYGDATQPGGGQLVNAVGPEAERAGRALVRGALCLAPSERETDAYDKATKKLAAHLIKTFERRVPGHPDGGMLDVMRRDRAALLSQRELARMSDDELIVDVV